MPWGACVSHALPPSGATPAPVLNDLRFCFLSNAVCGAGLTLEDAQVVQCRTVFAAGSVLSSEVLPPPLGPKIAIVVLLASLASRSSAVMM